MASDRNEGWRCRAPRSHGFCNTVNALDEAVCGACGADRPAVTTGEPNE